MEKERIQAYISGALTSIRQKVRVEILYEKIGKLCESKGIHAYIPHLEQNLDKNPDITFEEMYRSNMEQVDKSDLVVAYVGIPSQGTGMEIERAHQNRIGVFVLSEKGNKVSRMVRGCPSVMGQIEFSDFDEAMQKLEIMLDEWLKKRGRKEEVELSIQ
ncbi:MAG: nucleoside 2-deoxyribosyltransferase [Candidatus Eremiobacteraeota bacterium]|nr:nucleoside 2-deoxyribosyltransferase [Candidatus Eremiobacteraeota bacterium]